jgi:hypothetical protein
MTTADVVVVAAAVVVPAGLGVVLLRQRPGPATFRTLRHRPARHGGGARRLNSGPYRSRRRCAAGHHPRPAGIRWLQRPGGVSPLGGRSVPATESTTESTAPNHRPHANRSNDETAVRVAAGVAQPVATVLTQASTHELADVTSPMIETTRRAPRPLDVLSRRCWRVLSSQRIERRPRPDRLPAISWVVGRPSGASAYSRA